MKFRLLSVLVFLPGWLLAQDGMQLIQALQNRWNSVKDYSVQVSIKSEIPLIKSFPVKATIYFKQKNQFKMVSKGIAILPKQNLNELPKFLGQKNAYTALITGKEIFGSIACTQVTVLPTDDTGDLILLKLWIDTEKDLLIKSQTTTRSNGTIGAAYEYATQTAYGLPDKVVFTVDVKKFKIPKGLATDINRTSSAEKNQPTAKTGKISLNFTNYQLNKGLKDELFRH